MKLKLSFIAVLFFFTTFFIVVSNVYKDRAISHALLASLDDLNAHYKIINHNNKSVAAAIFKSIYSRNDIVEILSKTKNASDDEKKILRGELYQSLQNDFEALKKIGVNLILITEPSNKVFLRMHKPDIFGDDISRHRKAVAFVNKNHIQLDGFEQGKISHAFRNIFPIFDQNNNFIGTIDISFSSDSMQNIMDTVHQLHTHFLVSKRIIDSRVWELKNIATFYQTSMLTDQFMVSKIKDTTHKNMKASKKILNQNAEEIQTNLKRSKKFAIYGEYKSKVIVVSFQPIFSIQSDGVADAYLVSFTQNKTIEEIINDYLIIKTTSITLIGLILLLIYHLILKSHDLKNKTNYLVKTNKQLEESQKRLNEAQRISRTGSWEWHVQNNEAFWSNELYNIYGYDPSKKPDPDLLIAQVHPDDREQHLSSIEESLKTGKYRDEYRILREPDKKICDIYAIGEVIYDDKGKPLIHRGTIMDISERKAYENELRKQDEIMIAQSRHAAMGEMIGMIAHQWRQPISVIAMAANNIIADIAFDTLNKDELNTEVSNVLKQTDYLSQTIEDFRNFFRPEKEKELIDITSVINDALQIVGKSLEYAQVELQTHYKEISKVETYPKELMQVFINILKNAKEALVEHQANKRQIDIFVEGLEENIIVSICDNAGGVEPSIAKRIFEPYFTTKSESSGTGLGLYMSKTIIEKHLLGKLSLEHKDNGACFIVSLPIKLNEKDKT